MTILTYNTLTRTMEKRKILIDSRHKQISLDSDNEDINNHWNDPNTFAHIVLDIFNNDRCYDDFFKDKENLTILDVGGNIGLFSLYAQSRARDLYCLEPTPSHFKILSKYVEKYNNIHPLNIALSGYDGMIDFYTCPNNSTMNSIDARTGEKISVKGSRIGTLIKDLNLNHVDFIKLDIEGGEVFAITPETLNEVKDIVDNWFIEVHDSNGKNITQNRDILKLIFEDCNYDVTYYKNDTLYALKK